MIPLDDAQIIVASQVVDDTATADRYRPAVKVSRAEPQRDWIDVFAACVIDHESANAGTYTAQNPTSSASGAYQFVDGTWQHYASRLGYTYSRALHAPPRVQDEVFRLAASESPLHWKGTGCGHGT